MTFDEYQQAAMRTASKGSWEEQLAAGVMGLCGEAGETCDYIKKVLFHGHPIDPNKVAEELGDQLWYIALTSDAIGIDMSEIAKRNIEKLKRRYPNGFDPERSINRE
jgi:NTP pyrophosphatase (non-canonical NTP hydrolase)